MALKRVVERREPAAGIAGHHPAAVDQEHQPLALVDLVGADGQLPPPGRRPPVHVPGLVPLDVVAEPLELVVGPELSRPPDAQCAEPVAAGQHRVSGDLADVGIDPDLGPRRPGDRPLPEPEPARDEGVDAARSV